MPPLSWNRGGLLTPIVGTETSLYCAIFAGGEVETNKTCVLVWLVKDGTLDRSSSIGGCDDGEGAGH